MRRTLTSLIIGLICGLAFPSPGQMIISEFMADNATGLLDEDGDNSDWIEICNLGTNAVNIGGYALSDDAGDLQKWYFPPMFLAPGNCLIVFASNKDRDDPLAELHTNFKLSKDGEFLGLTAPDGTTIVHAYAPVYPQQYPDIAYGIGTLAVQTNLVGSNSMVRALIPSNGAISNAWTLLTHDDSGWLTGLPGVGFDLGGGFDPAIQLDVESQMQGVNPTAYMRIPLLVADASRVHNLILDMEYDDGFIAFLNGQEVARTNASESAAGPDKLVSYSVFDDANGTALTSVTVDRGGRRYIYGTNELIGAQLIHFKAGSANNNVVNNSLPAPPPFGRGTVLDGDFLLNTGTINPGGAATPPTADPVIDNATPANSTPGLAIVFDRALTNSAGDDLLFFELHNAGTGNGDAFHIMPLTGLTDNGWNAATIVNYDIPMSDASPIAGFQQYTFAPGIVSLAALETQTANVGTFSTGFKSPATGVDLSDMGVPIGGVVTGLFVMANSNGNGIDPVLIAGLPPASAESDDWRISALSDRNDALALTPQAFDLTAHIDLLLTGTNLLAIHGLSASSNDTDFLIRPRLEQETRVFDTNVMQYFTSTTPGGPNDTGASVLGPFILNGTDAWPEIGTNFTLTLTAQVAETTFTLQQVDVHFRTMFNSESTVNMRDDGVAPDATAADGFFTAVISGNLQPGELVRWRYEASDTNGRSSTRPAFSDPLDSDAYFGTIASNPTLQTSLLPIFHWFVQNPGAANNVAGTRCSAFFLGRFYDNIQIDRHGQSSSGFPKKSYDVDFNKGNRFKWAPGEKRVKDVNLITNWADKSRARNTLGYETVARSGAPSHFSFPIRIEQNGAFFSVADMVEDGDGDSLERNGLDPDGAFYKMYNRLETTASGIEKKTRKQEDASDLQAFIDGLTTGTAQQQRFYAYDHADIAAAANYYAVQSVYGNHDFGHKNYYMYRDTNGDREWFPITWDVDLSFGHRWNSIDRYFDDALLANNAVNVGAGNNRLRQDLFAYAPFYEMFVRRMRTLLDQMLQPPGTPVAQRFYERRLDEIADLIDPTNVVSDADLDYAAWGSWGDNFEMRPYIDRLKNEFFEQRRTFLYVTHSVSNGGVIPNAQPTNATIEFGTIEVSPASLNQDEEYIELINTNTYAVDITGWKLRGAAKFTFPPGTVIPSVDGGNPIANLLYVSPNVVAFRARTNAPSGNQGRFVQGPYEKRLSSFGGTIRLLDTNDIEIARLSYAGDGFTNQQGLVISEVMYHAAPPEGTELGLGFSSPYFDFIEIQNRGTETAGLFGIQFTDGVGFDFASSPVQQLGPGEHVVIVRNLAGFTNRYPDPSIRIAGEYSDDLNDGGERIVMYNAVLDESIAFEYNDGRGWPYSPDGAGHSLIPQKWDTQTDNVLDYGGNWRASAFRFGSPGKPDPAPLRDVVINEFAAHTDTMTTNESNDWIEFFNPNSTNINFADWYLSDDPYDLKKWPIPSTNTMSPLDWLAFDEVTGFHNPTNTGFGLSKRGEQILASYLPGNASDRVADSIQFKGQENGATEGRYPDGAAWHPRLDPTRDASNRLLGPSIVIEEVMYHPKPTATHPEDNEHDEYIVLYNDSAAPVALTNEVGAWRIDGEVSFLFPSNTVLNPGERLAVVSFNPTNPAEVAAFESLYGLSNGALPILGNFSGKLSNHGGRLAVEYPQDGDLPGESISWIVVDEIIYFDRCTWPRSADGTGLALHRVDPALSGNIANNWEAGAPWLTSNAINYPSLELSIQSKTNGMRIDWRPLFDLDYDLEYADSLLFPMWNHLISTNTTNANAIYLDRSTTNTWRRYYRVRTRE